MQKREQGKMGTAGAAGNPPAKRGRPFGSGANATTVGASNDSIAPCLLGPSLQVHNSLADPNNKRIVLALQSGLKSELTWALNTLTTLSFREKDDSRNAFPLAKIPGLLDALLQVIDDWHDIAFSKELAMKQRVRLLGANSTTTGFGTEYATSVRHRPSEWWYNEDELFNIDEGRAEKQLCAVAASNVIRNFSFMPENEPVMAVHRHCLETEFQCIEDYLREDEELVTNCLETVINLAPLLDLRIFSSTKTSFIMMTGKRAVEAIIRMLESSGKIWHCAAAELIGRLIINPDNEPFLLPFFSQVYKRLVDLLGFSVFDAQAAAVGALYNHAEVNVDCRLKLAQERWAIDRLLKIVKAPHPLPEVCRKAAMILESLVSEPQNRGHLLLYEHAFVEVLFSDSRYSDIFARILYELTSRPSNRVSAARGFWGM